MSRLNPALATMLSKGPPVTSTHPIRAEGKSAPEPITSSTGVDEGIQLTHLTKGRARGPKKRSNSTKPAMQKSESQMTETVAPVELSPKRPIVQDPDSLLSKVSVTWNKPTKLTNATTSEKPIEPMFSSQDAMPQASAPRDRQPPSLSPGSMRQRLVELSPLRRDTKSSTRGLFGSLLRAPPQGSKPRYPTIEVIRSSVSAKIQDKERLFVQAWSILSRVKHVSLPNSEEHILYSGDMHAFLYMYNDAPGSSEPSSLKFLWLGRDCKLSVSEGMEFVRLMGDPNADTQIIQQGQESSLFIRALGGVIVTRKGSRRPLHSVEDELFCIRACLGGISIDQVEFQKGEFCSGFSYVVKKNMDVVVWHGRGSFNEEIAAARRFAGEISSQTKEMMESNPHVSAALWRYFEDEEYASGGFWHRKYDLKEFSPVLYLIEGQKVIFLQSYH